MAPVIEISHLANPLASASQLEISASQLDGVPKDLEDSILFESTRLAQAAGILLRLPQQIIAQSIVIIHRFWTGADGGSMIEHDTRSVVAAALYLTAKSTAYPVSPKHVLVVCGYLASIAPNYQDYERNALTRPSLTREMLSCEWSISAGRFDRHRVGLYWTESHILRVLGFQTHVALPYSLCINYLQALEVFNSDSGSSVAKSAFALLNTALHSTQRLYITHQPPALATAAIYLAARENGVKLPEANWWEVYDVDREELGFLVVAMRSVEGFAREEQQKWADRKVPLKLKDLRAELGRRHLQEAD